MSSQGEMGADARPPFEGWQGRHMAVTLFIAVVDAAGLGSRWPLRSPSRRPWPCSWWRYLRKLVVFKEMFTGIDSFPLMAVPFSYWPPN